MADHYPLIVTSNTLQEVPAGDNISLSSSGLVGATKVESTDHKVSGISSIAELYVNTVNQTPIHEPLTVYVTTGGNDVTGDGTEANPYATPHRAIRALRSRRISLTEGYDRVTISVGVGTYNFGLKQIAAGQDYFNATYPLTGGTGQGAFVAITTTTGGAIKSAKLLDPGFDYQASDVLGITSVATNRSPAGTGAQFALFHVGIEGNILGPISLDHPDGDEILMRGAPPGPSKVGIANTIKPGRMGNHFYNQVGVGLGSNPAGTGGEHRWSDVYDATSPIEAYPNPMVSARFNLPASEAYNRKILEDWYATVFYFHGCDGFTSSNPKSIKIDNFLLQGWTSKGVPNYATVSTGSSITTSTYGLTNNVPDGIQEDPDDDTFESNTLTRGGSFEIGENLAIHGFAGGGLFMYGGGICRASNVTITNTHGTGINASRNSTVIFTNGRSLNNRANAISNTNASIDAAGAVLANSNNGVSANYQGFSFLGNQARATFTPGQTTGVGNSTIIANNHSYGIVSQNGAVVRSDGRQTTNLQFVYGNGRSTTGAQLFANDNGYIETTNANRLRIFGAAGTATTTSPGFGVLGNNNSYISL